MRTFILFLLLSINTYSQVGIGTTNPDSSSILDINSNNKGVLLPRLTNTERNTISSPAKGLVIFNSTTNSLEINTGTPSYPLWQALQTNNIVSTDSNNIISTGTDGGAYLASTSYSGKFIINNSGHITITGIPFKPSRITFVGHANVESYNLSDDNEMNQNNHSGISNAFASMNGYATNYDDNIQQQVIAIGAHGNSINDISRFASSSHAIGIRYGNQNGNLLGHTKATVTAFNSDGFTINVNEYADGMVILFEAYR
ncbi:hypothetical protein [Pseudofulvibacter geojedonensis]|uniref:Uncharacterized protein n=1 Tax=Pseudofulvibacter geojedonensis TaxID=1123758 RepID=A0ABW3I1L4_9FLAO